MFPVCTSCFSCVISTSCVVYISLVPQSVFVGSLSLLCVLLPVSVTCLITCICSVYYYLYLLRVLLPVSTQCLITWICYVSYYLYLYLLHVLVPVSVSVRCLVTCVRLCYVS